MGKVLKRENSYPARFAKIFRRIFLNASLGSANLDLTSLTERFQTRFQSVRLQPPENEVSTAFRDRRWSAPIGIIRKIGKGTKGNVRAVMADLEMWMG